MTSPIRPARHWVIGDVHGCAEALRRLLRLLPAEDRLIFNGDVINRGPQILEAMELVWSQVRSGRGVWLQGNHEAEGAQIGLLDGRAATTFPARSHWSRITINAKFTKAKTEAYFKVHVL